MESTWNSRYNNTHSYTDSVNSLQVKLEENLYKKLWLHWRGKAGAYAKSGDNTLLKLSNEQKLRYFNKYCDEANIPLEERKQAIKNKLV